MYLCIPDCAKMCLGFLMSNTYLLIWRMGVIRSLLLVNLAEDYSAIPSLHCVSPWSPACITRYCLSAASGDCVNMFYTVRTEINFWALW